MRQISVAILFASVALSASSLSAASADFSGTWKGSISGIENCPNGRAVNSLLATATFDQSGDSVSGAITLFGNDPCVPSSPASTFTLPVSGPASGSTLVTTFKAPDGETIRSAIEVNGNLMTLTITGTNDRGGAFGPITGTLVRASGQATEITRFLATPSTISAGDSATLIWAVTNATSVVIDNGIGPVRPVGSITISPTETTTYTITATGTSTVTAKTTVTVAGAGPRVAIGERPQGMLQIAGNSGGTDSFVVANIGSAATTVTLSQSGNFFELDRTSFTLQPRAAQPVAIKALAQPAGVYTGTVTIASGTQTLTVLVRLLVAARPPAPVDPRPTAARFETSAPAGQNPPTVSARFTNRGSGVVQALVVTDVPWIIPVNTMVTIQPGQSQDLAFPIDRTKRDDGGAIGSAAGNLTIRFLGPGSGISAFGTGGSTSPSASTQVIDVVKATASTGMAPALQSGEVAFYLPGCGTIGTTVCDAFFSSRATSAVTDLRLLLPTNQQIATVAALNSNLSVGFLSLTRTVFGFEGSTSLQGRSAQTANLSVSALRIVNPEASLAYATSMPVLRSDRGVSAGNRLVLSGVQRGDSYTTSITVQELSGTAATAELQAYNATGVPVGSASTITIPAFGETNDGGSTTIAGAGSVVIRNTSSGTGRINAVGRVENSTTKDTWILLEPSITAGFASTTLIMPMPSSAGTVQTKLFVTNVTGAPVEVRTETVGGLSRRRAVGAGSTSVNLVSTTTLGSLQTISPAVNATAGYVRLGAPEGSISASARMTLLGSSGEAFGGALPLVPDSTALRPTEIKRFAGVDDASAASISAKVPSTYRTSLIMVETGGASTSVQVTLRFVLAGTLASSRATISKVFTIGAGQALTISDLASAVIGLSRDTLGNLRNMQLDVQVLDGGRVLPFVQSIDNATGDVTMRSE